MATNYKYPLSKPYITEKEIKAVESVLRSGVLSLGKKTEEFEKAFAKKIGVKYAVAVNSGTSGLHLAMIACGIKEGDEVITTPFSFVASANSCLLVGAKPVFCDIDETTFNIDSDKIEEKITKKTKAILVAHILGQACDMAKINKIAKKHNLIIIEDACESIMATYKSQSGVVKKVGAFGEASVFAFYPNKQMTTGEGGMICTNSQKVYKMCLSLRNQGRNENRQWLDHERLGYNYRLTEMQAALGLEQLKKLDWMIKQRQRVAMLYTKELKKYPELILAPETDAHNTHTWFVYVTRVKNFTEKQRNQLIEKMKMQAIQTKPYFPSIHLFSFYRNTFGYKKGDFPVSEKASDTSIALPFYLTLQKDDICCIVEALIKNIRAIKK